MNILYIVPYAPTLIRVRPYNLVRGLAQHKHRVLLHTLYESQKELESLKNLRLQGIEVTAFPLTKQQILRNTLGALPTRYPLQSAYSWHPDLANAIRQTILTHDIDIVHVEHLRGGRYGQWLQRQRGSQKIPIVWDSVDCISYLFQQALDVNRGMRTRLISIFELERTRHLERQLVNQFDHVLVTSKVDKLQFQRLMETGGSAGYDSSRISVLPNGVDLEYFRLRNEEQVHHTNTLIFSGKMSYHANESAVEYLVTQIMPLVWQARPDVKLVIAGSQPSAKVRRLAVDSRIQVTGYVTDMRVSLWQADVSVAPLIYGAGIQNKVIEAMACGIPVVATSLAVAALDITAGIHCLVADTPGAFADAIIRLLLGDVAFQRRIVAAGRSYVESNHDWVHLSEVLGSIYSHRLSV